MPRPKIEDNQDKWRRYRARRKHEGMKQLRLWVPDPKAPGFAAALAKQVACLRGKPEEADALAFIAAIAGSEGWPE